VKSDGEGRRDREREVDPLERKSRNRTWLMIVILALVNMYVFVWRDESFDFSAEAAAIRDIDASGVAAPPDGACSGDPVRIFDGLADQLRLQTRLSEGKTLRLGLLELGVTGPEIDMVEAAVRTHISLGLLAGSGAPLSVALDRYGGVQALEVELAEGHLVQACRASDGLRVRNIQHPLRTDVEVIAFEISDHGTLLTAVEERGEKPELARLISDTLAYDIDFSSEARPGDRLQVIVEKRYLGRSFHRYANLMAARYRGAAGYFAYYYYKPKGAAPGYFDGDGQPVRRELLRSPVAWYPFDAEARATMPPIIEFVDGKVGALYRRPEGAPVVALGDGTIRDVKHREDTGLTVEVTLRDGRVVRYAHLMRTVGELELGQSVEQGQIIGLVGHSGKTPVDRLRIEIVEDPEGAAEHVDPIFLTAKNEERPERVGEPIDPKLVDRFQKDIKSWRRAMRQVAR
jgi:murein DD-endopeptidase MepM/ murein hydrolase activator NlpD